MVSQLVQQEYVKDLKSINLYGKMAIPDMCSVRDPIDTGIDGHAIEPQQKSRYLDMVKVACLDFKQSNIKYKHRSFSQEFLTELNAELLK